MDTKPALRALSFAATRNLLRVAVVTETYPPEVNGVAMTIGRMVDGLARGGHSVQLIRPRQSASDTPGCGSALEEVVLRGLPIPRYPDLKLGLPAKGRLVELWSRRRPDIVHIVTEGPLGWSALAAGRALRLPVTSDFHTNFHRYSRHYGIGWLARPIAAYLRSLHNRADATFVPTRSLHAELSADGFQKLRILARGVDTTLFHPSKRSRELRSSWGLTDRQLAVIHVGRLAPEKNLGLVLRAFEAVQSARPDARLVLVGDGPVRTELAQRCPQHVFAGMRVGEELASHYASGDLFLFPSLTETFGNVTLEAMASGLAVVAYDYAAAAEHLRSRDSGVLVAPGDETGFMAAARALASDPPLLTRLRGRARESVAPLDWERISDAFALALADTVGARKNPEASETAHVVAPD